MINRNRIVLGYMNFVRRTFVIERFRTESNFAVRNNFEKFHLHHFFFYHKINHMQRDNYKVVVSVFTTP